MEKTIHQIKAAMAGLLGLLTGLWGWFGWLVVGWIGCMAMDYVTGSMAAAKEGEWPSARAREGIWRCPSSTRGWCVRWCWCGTS